MLTTCLKILKTLSFKHYIFSFSILILYIFNIITYYNIIKFILISNVLLQGFIIDYTIDRFIEKNHKELYNDVLNQICKNTDIFRYSYRPKNLVVNIYLLKNNLDYNKVKELENDKKYKELKIEYIAYIIHLVIIFIIIII